MQDFFHQQYDDQIFAEKMRNRLRRYCASSLCSSGKITTHPIRSNTNTWIINQRNLYNYIYIYMYALPCFWGLIMRYNKPLDLCSNQNTPLNTMRLMLVRLAWSCSIVQLLAGWNVHIGTYPITFMGLEYVPTWMGLCPQTNIGITCMDPIESMYLWYIHIHSLSKFYQV